LFFPYEVHEYYPEAAWGGRTITGGCPSHTPALEINAKNPDWLKVVVGIWDSKQTKLRELNEPTLFIHFVHGWHLLISEQERRARIAIPVTSSTPYLDISLADGTTKQIRLEWLESEYAWRTARRDVPLEVAPQSMTVIFPDLMINNEPLRLGAVQFIYRKSTRYPC
jgi:hypothetical protein